MRVGAVDAAAHALADLVEGREAGNDEKACLLTNLSDLRRGERALRWAPPGEFHGGRLGHVASIGRPVPGG